MTPLLVADSIGRAFGTRRVLTSARLVATPGSITAIAGRNGSGKSTLLRICAGMLAPDHGTVRYDGVLYTRPRLHELARRGLFFLPDRDILSPGVTIRAHLEAVARRFASTLEPETAARDVGIEAFLDRDARRISGGERRRAELAMVLVRAPRCLIADEPLRGIDPRDTDMIIHALRVLAAAGCAVIVSGHEMYRLLDAADTVVWVTAGTTRELGAPADARSSEQFRREYLTGSWV